MKHTLKQLPKVLTTAIVVTFGLGLLTAKAERSKRHGKGIDEHDIEMAIGVLIDIRPELKGKIENNPAMARRIVTEHRNIGSFSNLLTLKARSPEDYQLKIDEIKADTMLRESRARLKIARKRNDAAAIERHEKSIRLSLEKQYELKIRAARMRVDRMRAQLHKEESKLMDLIADQDVQVNKKLSKMTKARSLKNAKEDSVVSDLPHVDTGRSQDDFPVSDQSALETILPGSPSEEKDDTHSKIRSDANGNIQSEDKARLQFNPPPKIHTHLKRQQISKSEWRRMSPKERRAYLSAVRDRWNTKKR